jgi:hypothetical protein
MMGGHFEYVDTSQLVEEEDLGGGGGGKKKTTRLERLGCFVLFWIFLFNF